MRVEFLLKTDARRAGIQQKKSLGLYWVCGCVGGEEAVHMPAGFTYVTEEHFSLVKWTLYKDIGSMWGLGT